MKLVFAARGLPICDYEVVLKRDWQRDERAMLQTRRRPPRLPGVRQAGQPRIERRHLEGEARRRAARRRSRSPPSSTARSSSRRRCRTRARSKCAVLGNDEPEASVPGEIVPSREFYDYEAKYLDDGSTHGDPAPLDASAQTAEVRALAIAAFKAIDGAGMARVDFLLAGDSRRALPERGEHHSRLHDDQHVLEDVGGERAAVRAAARSPDRARDRAPRARSSNCGRACEKRVARPQIF